MGGLLKIMGFIFVLLIVAQMLPKTPSINQAQTGKAMSEEEILKARKEAEGRCPDPEKCREANRKAYANIGVDWRYWSDKDQMRGTQIKMAQLDSRQKLEFAFPYSGGSTVTLALAKRGGATNVSLRINKGQFICYGDRQGEIRAKFDNSKIQDFRCVRAADASSDVIFIEPEGRFLAALKGSKKLLVEVTFFNQGRRQIPFNTAGLSWK